MQIGMTAMKRTLTATLLALGLLSLPVMASAATTAWTNAAVNLRTGPAADYPRILTLRAGQPVEVYGCINDWSWCDVSQANNRGWVSAAFLDYDTGGRRIALSSYGARSGLAVLDFVIGTYWERHYRNTSWYGQRSHYEQRHPQHAGGVPRAGKTPPRSSNGTTGAPRPTAPSTGRTGTPQAGRRPQKDGAQGKGSGNAHDRQDDGHRAAVRRPR
ncbi:SH3 domain-containing protein [Luteimonas sp. BDR2-5]|uniref:SH3 domain-containing protein n=1 Tax=Proluteimonas luteida TaxID=2878685 RepID=UPI001E3F9BE9|nr:SH3 domain-containing protein [Luteimonas sp. BDR2-5]MCD9028583.1 SH3 domain-containing protein [Luteimonas sp. BDR2-5]